MPATVPPGFEPLPALTGFLRTNGPFYRKLSPDGAVEYGFIPDERHGNMNDMTHGGIVVAFLDTISGNILRVGAPADIRLATISLTTRYLSGVRLGTWICGRAMVRKRTRQIAFVDAEAFSGEDLLATANGVFRISA